MATWVEVGPAYGRDYKNQKEVKDDWKNGKDFVVLDLFTSGKYINKEDADREGVRVIVRYSKMMKTVQVQ